MDDIEIAIPKLDDWAPLQLDKLSIETLKIYVNDLKTELIRVEKEIANRHLVRNEADAMFKK